MSWSGQSWGPEQPRFVADLTGDGRADIVGFGLDGVWASLNNGNGTFQPPNMVLSAFSFHTGWLVERHPRFLADVTGDGRADIIGFGDAGVWTARNNGDGTFQSVKFVVADRDITRAGAWISIHASWPMSPETVRLTSSDLEMTACGSP
jgi:VCBS repeat protein